jgi:hypothetical protein
MWKRIKEKWKDPLFKTAIKWMASILAIAIFIGWVSNCSWSWIIKSGSNQEEIDAYLYFITGAATVFLAIIAWYQLTPIKKDIEGEFLLNIFKEWSSDNITRARREISEMYKEIEDSGISPKDCELSVRIDSLKTSKKEKEREKYYRIINFLNLLEFIGHFYRHDYISLPQIEDLLGEALINYGNKLEHYMFSSKGTSKTYQSFETLYKKLLEEKKNIES